MNGRHGPADEIDTSFFSEFDEPYDGYEDIPEDFFDESEEEAEADNATPTIH